jgi:hypothetical protein
MKNWPGLVCTGLLLALTGCGGGGSGGSGGSGKATLPVVQPPTPPPTPPIVDQQFQSYSPTGIWHGTGLDDRTLTALVLGSGEFLVIYSAAGNAAVTGGLVQGVGTLSGNTFSSFDVVDLNFEGAGSNATDLTATTEFRTSLNGSLIVDSDRSITKDFTFTFSSLSSQAPALARVAGVYNGELAGLVGAEHYTVTIDDAGAITATATSGCLVTGIIRPQVLTNIYDIEITFGPAPCFRPGKVVSGMGAYDPNTNLLTIGLVDSARNRGLVFSGNREGGVDFDGDGMADGEDADDDNDCVVDTDDQCPLDPNPGCPDTVLVDNQEWQQPSLFKNLTWDDINAACPASNAGNCSGTLAGRDMTGWTWASNTELRALFDVYKFVIPPLGLEQDFYLGPISLLASQQAAAEWYASGWRPARTQCEYLHCNFIYAAYTRDASDDGNDPEYRGVTTVWLAGLPISTSTLAFYGLVLMHEYADTPDLEQQGAWFYRSQPISANCPHFPTAMGPQ